MWGETNRVRQLISSHVTLLFCFNRRHKKVHIRMYEHRTTLPRTTIRSYSVHVLAGRLYHVMHTS
jgi:hypothetical protein